MTDLEPTLTQQQRAWLSLTQPVGLLGATALLAAPTEFAKEAIERSLRDGITTTLSRHLGQPIKLAVTVSEDAGDSVVEPADRRYPRDRVGATADRFLPGAGQRGRHRRPAGRGSRPARFRRRHGPTFDGADEDDGR